MIRPEPASSYRDTRSWEKYIYEGWFPYLWIIIAVYFVFLKALTFTYTSLDDYALILGNKAFLSEPASLIDVFRQTVFNHPGDIYYRPLMIITFVVDCLIGHGNPFMYHLTNICIHALACCLLFILMKTIGQTRKMSLALTLLFTVHPVLTQAVAWIPGRNDSLMAVFFFLSFIFFIRYLETEKVFFLIGNGLFLLCGLLTKETTLALVVLCLLYARLFRNEIWGGRKIIIFLAQTFFVLIVWHMIRSRVITGFNTFSYALMFVAFFKNFIVGICEYLGKSFFPFHLSVMPYSGDISPVPGIAAVLLIFALVVTASSEKRKRIVFWLSWFLLCVMPVLFHSKPELYEHRLYVPLVGVIMLIPEIGIWDRIRPSLRAVLWCVVMLFFVSRTFAHADSFYSSLKFAMNAVETSPGSPASHCMLAEAYLERGFLEGAKNELGTALNINNHFSRANLFMGHVYLLVEKQPKKARYYYAVSYAGDPANDSAVASLAQLNLAMGQFQKARLCIVLAMRLNPGKKEYQTMCFTIIDKLNRSRSPRKQLAASSCPKNVSRLP